MPFLFYFLFVAAAVDVIFTMRKRKITFIIIFYIYIMTESRKNETKKKNKKISIATSLLHFCWTEICLNEYSHFDVITKIWYFSRAQSNRLGFVFSFFLLFYWTVFYGHHLLNEKERNERRCKYWRTEESKWQKILKM